METSRPHQNSLSSVPKEEFMKGFYENTISKRPLLFSTPLKKPYSQPAKKDDGENHTLIARGNPKATENLLAAKINGGNVQNSTCSPPIKTPFGTPSQLQTPTSRLSFLSANKKNQSVGTGGCGVNGDASITRTPFRLLAGKNLNVCLFSPSQTPRAIAFPAPLNKLASPSLEGRARRVLVMPPELPAARRVPVKHKRGQQTPAGKQSPFATPKSSRLDYVQFSTPKSSRLDYVQFSTPKSGRVDNVSRASGQNDDSNLKILERSAWLKRATLSTPQQDLFATPKFSRAEHLLETAGQNSAVSEGKRMTLDNTNVKYDRPKQDRSELLIRALASMSQLSSQARRVPLRQKREQTIEKPPPPLPLKEKQQPSNKKALSEKPKTCKSGQKRKQICQNEAGALDGKGQSETNHLPKSAPKRRGGNCIDKTKQQGVDNHAVKDGSSKPKGKGGNSTHNKTKKQSVASHGMKAGSSKPKEKGGNRTDKAKQQSVDNHAIKSASSKQHVEGINMKCGKDSCSEKQQSVDDHAVKSSSSKQHDEDIDKKCGEDSCSEKANDVNQFCEDAKQRETCDVDVGHNDYHDVGDDVKQRCNDDGTKHQADDLSEADKCQLNTCRHDEKQHKDNCVDNCVDAGGGDDAKDHYGDGSEHCGNDNGSEQHGYHDGNDADIRDTKNDADDQKQHDDDDTEKQHDHAKAVKKQQNNDGRKQNDDDNRDDHVEIGVEDAECMKQHDYDVDIE